MKCSRKFLSILLTVALAVGLWTAFPTSVEADVPSADLSITKTVSDWLPSIGDEITYIVTVTNNGPDDATDVTVKDPLSSCFNFISYVASSGGIYYPDTGIWDIGDLDNGNKVALTIKVRIYSSDMTRITNTASIASCDQPDPNTDNNSASVDILVGEYNTGSLIFDTADGLFRHNRSPLSEVEYIGQKDKWEWDDSTSTLTLKGFLWTTNSLNSLIITGGPLTINLAPGSANVFISEYESVSLNASTRGIWAQTYVSITGAGILRATGGYAVNGESFGIEASDNFSLNGGTLVAAGYTSALKTAPSALPSVYTYRTNTAAYAPSGAGTLYFPGSAESPYIYSTGDKYVSIASTRAAIVSNAIIGGMAGTALSAGQTATVKLYGDSLLNTLSGTDVSSWFSGLPSGVTVTASSSDSETILLTFSGTPSAALAASFNITIPASALTSDLTLAVNTNADAKFDITASPYTPLPLTYALTIKAETGGSITTGVNGDYEHGTIIDIAATARSGYTFSGWTTSSGGTFGDMNCASTTFTMPSNATTITANFTKDTTSPKSVKYKIMMYANGGKFTNGKITKVLSIGKGKKVGKLAVPTRNGYKFLGWFTKKTGGVKVTSKLVIKKNTSLYAHWAHKGTVNTMTGNLHLRSKASITSSILSKYPKGTKVLVLSKKGGWYKVQVGKKSGWMYKKYIKLA